MMAALSANASAREFVVTILARNPAPRVRRQMGQLLVGARPMAGTLLRWLAGELEVSRLGTAEDELLNGTIRLGGCVDGHSRDFRSRRVCTLPLNVLVAQ